MTTNKSSPGTVKLAFQPAQSNDQFIKLFSVEISHSYYTESGGLCPDFRAAPTPATVTLMAAFGIACRNDAAGFSVFIQRGKLPALIAYLQHSAQADPGSPSFWQRLTFSLYLVNPLFIGITALPIDTKTTQVNLYGCNTQAHRDSDTEGDAALLSGGNYLGTAALYPVVGSEMSLILPPQTRYVTVTDISGAIVIPPPQGQDIEVSVVGQASDAPRQALLNLSGLPYDLYTIAILDQDRQPISGGGYPRTVLYIAQQADALVLLDMLFTRPTPDSAGIYPIAPLFGGDVDLAQCGNLAYRLAFDARSTYWQYFVISQDPQGQLSALQIQGSGTQFEQQAEPVALPDGSSAVLFTAASALPLQQKSSQRFQLSGRRSDADGQQNDISVSRLPVAPSAPVWPAMQQSTSGISEIFVYV